MNKDIQAITARVEEKSKFCDTLTEQLHRAVVGQDYLIQRLIIGLLADGHMLLEGVPGLAKTLAVRSLAQSIDASFQRIQFTPDLLPADLIGTLIYDQKSGDFKVKKGPVFAHVILADEINRAPAKVQSALLEAMQEHQVTIGDTTYPLPAPFVVLATQNPIEQEGTYPLPEAQIDRFMLKLKITYPSRADELNIIKMYTGNESVEVSKVIGANDILDARTVVNEIYIDEKVQKYIVDIVYATREPKEYNLPDLASLIEFGASPRASLYLTKAAKAHAFMKHRGYVTPEDVRIIGADVLRHRVILSYEAEVEEISSDDIVKKIFDGVEVP